MQYYVTFEKNYSSEFHIFIIFLPLNNQDNTIILFYPVDYYYVFLL